MTKKIIDKYIIILYNTANVKYSLCEFGKMCPMIKILEQSYNEYKTKL